MERYKWSGLLFFLATLQLTLMIIVAEAQYDGYNAGANYISDLGVWGHGSAIIFNPSVILFGIMVLVGTWLFYQHFRLRLPMLLFVLSGIGAIGVGIFTEEEKPWHFIFSFVVFFFGLLGVLVLGKELKSPFNYLSYALSLIGLTALVLYGAEIFLGIGPGGMERMICYPVFGWMMAFGGALMLSSDVVRTTDSAPR